MYIFKFDIFKIEFDLIMDTTYTNWLEKERLLNERMQHPTQPPWPVYEVQLDPRESIGFDESETIFRGYDKDGNPVLSAPGVMGMTQYGWPGTFDPVTKEKYTQNTQDRFLGSKGRKGKHTKHKKHGGEIFAPSLPGSRGRGIGGISHAPKLSSSSGGGKSNWINHVQKVRAESGCSFKDALKKASHSYKK